MAKILCVSSEVRLQPVVSHISMDGVSIQWPVTPHAYDCLFGLSKSHRYRV